MEQMATTSDKPYFSALDKLGKDYPVYTVFAG